MKNTSKKLNRQINLANSCGVIGYFFGTLTWLWSALFYLNPIFKLNLFNDDSTIPPITPVPPKPASPLSSELSLIIAGFTAILVIGLTIYALFKIPSMISRSSQEVLSKATNLTIPLITKLRKKKTTKKQHLKLTTTVVVLLKIFLFMAPIGLLFASYFLEEQIEINLELRALVGLFLAFWGLVGFLAQYSLAYFFKIKSDDLK